MEPKLGNSCGVALAAAELAAPSAPSAGADTLPKMLPPLAPAEAALPNAAKPPVDAAPVDAVENPPSDSGVDKAGAEWVPKMPPVDAGVARGATPRLKPPPQDAPTANVPPPLPLAAGAPKPCAPLLAMPLATGVPNAAGAAAAASLLAAAPPEPRPMLPNDKRSRIDSLLPSAAG